MRTLPPISISNGILSTLLKDDEWQKGKLCRRARIARSELIEREQEDFADVEDQVSAVADMLESPIEQVAAYHLLGRNYAPFTSAGAVYARVYRDLPEQWPEGVIIAIVPQVEIGRYRVDFMAHLRNGAKFAIECDGEEYHDDIKDGLRDAKLTAFFKLPVLRFTGSSIWESPLWTNEVRKMVFMLLGMRNAERVNRRG
jgi:very-short-patch-repair endonuclease